MNDQNAQLPAWRDDAHGIRWLAHELQDHLWPWRRERFRRALPLQLASLLLGAAVTVAWVLAASGGLRGELLIGWWLAWSAMEIGVRLQTKPYVKEGPWWGRNYRPAGPMDMLCYVSFKNLLIGAALFITLKSLGVLNV